MLCVIGASAATIQDFDDPEGICSSGTTCATLKIENDPAPALFVGGPTGAGHFLRLGYGEPYETPNFNTITFDQTESASPLTIVDFDFRITPGETRGDGLGFSLLNVVDFDKTGAFSGAGEEPNYTNSFGVGFDIHENEDLQDIGNDIVRPDFSNSISLHFNGVIAQADVTPVVDIANSLWLHARIVLRAIEGGTIVTVSLGVPDNPLVPVFNDYFIEGLEPYESRAHFGARSGGESAEVDIDNLSIQYVSDAVPEFALSQTLYRASEKKKKVAVTVLRSGNVANSAHVDLIASATGSAQTGIDFVEKTVEVNFAENETSKTVTFEIIDDGDRESDEQFEVKLQNPRKGGAVIGPAAAGVTIVDNETAKRKGAWDRLYRWPIVAVHMHLLPNGKVSIWDRLGSAALWDPATGEAVLSSTPGYNLFCSGHVLLADGRLLVTGGHADLGGHPSADGVGEEEASLYVPESDSWLALPNMNDRRWYPTNYVLPNGDVLVLSGTINGFATENKNTLPQILEVAKNQWRNLTTADDGYPLGVDLYPRLFVAPNGKIFKAGMDSYCFYLDTSGTGEWSPGPGTRTGYHIYGTATQYAPFKILATGGSDLHTGSDSNITPNNKAEVIDLNETKPKWRKVSEMNEPRRHHNTVVLPDGNVLVIGGSSGKGFSNAKFPVYSAELWNSTKENWRLMASMRVPRLYHSTAFLLPDGRVLSAGSGHGGWVSPNFQNVAEIYLPPYMFKGKRPAILSAPSAITYGAPFLVESTQLNSIQTICLIRLASVTHSYDMNQNYVPLEFAIDGGYLTVNAPASGIIAQPGHYMLFVVNKKGVPSRAAIVQLQ